MSGYVMETAVLGEHGETRHGAYWITVPCPRTCVGVRLVAMETAKLGRCSERYCT